MKLAKNKKLASMFGQLELRYTRNRCYSRYEDHESVSAYKVVAKEQIQRSGREHKSDSRPPDRAYSFRGQPLLGATWIEWLARIFQAGQS
jgi:hypothetical protein